jgi:hypothetical protein
MSVDWIYLIRDWDQWQAVVNVVNDSSSYAGKQKYLSQCNDY